MMKRIWPVQSHWENNEIIQWLRVGCFATPVFRSLTLNKYNFVLQLMCLAGRHFFNFNNRCQCFFIIATEYARLFPAYIKFDSHGVFVNNYVYCELTSALSGRFLLEMWLEFRILSSDTVIQQLPSSFNSPTICLTQNIYKLMKTVPILCISNASVSMY